MTDEVGTGNSIAVYKTQLKQVEEALKKINDPIEYKTLEDLRNNLLELLDLTLQTPKQNQYQPSAVNGHKSEKLNFDDEICFFMSEIKSLESVSLSQLSPTNETSEKNLQKIKDNSQDLIGRKCSAPYINTWSSTTYHNAIICALDDSCDYEMETVQNISVRIFFTNPVCKKMVPCDYFLHGLCRFNAVKCYFSHGELVEFNDLKDYQEPDFTKLEKNCIVLAKLEDKIWHRGRITGINICAKSCVVRLENQKTEIELDFENLFPIFQEGNTTESENFSSDSDSEYDLNDVQQTKLTEQTLFNPLSNKALGDWEKHTRGIGLKLMEKMGYIKGNGLGLNGKGIINPISAQILPSGRSLDYCMNLREMANGDKNFFTVEEKLEREKEKTTMIYRKTYEQSLVEKTDVFSFLNNEILKTKKNKEQQRKDYKSQSTKDLNVESVRIADEIRKKTRDILNIKKSIKRQSIDSNAQKRLQSQLTIMNKDLIVLKKSAESVGIEQTVRKNEKYFSF